MRRRPRALGIIALTLVASVPAAACPLLLCVTFDIGQARSLPAPPARGPAPDYDLRHLVGDTLEVLDAQPPALVALETVRRAYVHLVQADDAPRAAALREELRRALGEPSGWRRSARDHFVAGFYQALLELSPPRGLRTSRVEEAGVTLLRRAVALDPDEPVYALGLAVVLYTVGDDAAGRPSTADDWLPLLRTAAAAAKSDPALARNLRPIVEWVLAEHPQLRKDPGLASAK